MTYRESAKPPEELMNYFKVAKEYYTEYNLGKLGLALSPILLLFWNYPLIPYWIMQVCLLIVALSGAAISLDVLFSRSRHCDDAADFHYGFLAIITSLFTFFFFLRIFTWNTIFYMAISCLGLVLFASWCREIYERNN